MTARSKADVVRDCFTAWRTDDRGLIEAALDDAFTFTSPYDDAIDEATYFERCWPNRHLIRRHALEDVVEHGDDVFVRCLCETADGRAFRNVEVFRVVDGKVRRIDVYFGASYRDGTFVAST